MKKLLLLALAGTGFMCANSANAGVATMLGDGTCYVFKQGKFNTKSQCKVYTESGANSVYPMYGFENYSVKIPQVGVIKKIASTNCMSEKSCKSIYTVNGKKAKSEYRFTNQGYQIVSNKQAEKLLKANSDRQDLLTCDKTIDNKLEICMPVNDTGKSEMADRPKWAE